MATIDHQTQSRRRQLLTRMCQTRKAITVYQELAYFSPLIAEALRYATGQKLYIRQELKALDRIRKH